MEKKRGKNITLITSEEMTSIDKKKLRKFYKEKNKAEKQQKAQEEAYSGKVGTVLTDKQVMGELKGDKRVTLAHEKDKKKDKKRDHSNSTENSNNNNASGNPSYSNSSNFFNYLQKETEATIHGKKRKLEEKNEEMNGKRGKKGDKSSVASVSSNLKL
jgi:hypothetical protein